MVLIQVLIFQTSWRFRNMYLPRPKIGHYAQDNERVGRLVQDDW